jgi:hypothetical protein
MNDNESYTKDDLFWSRFDLQGVETDNAIKFLEFHISSIEGHLVRVTDHFYKWFDSQQDVKVPLDQKEYFTSTVSNEFRGTHRRTSFIAAYILFENYLNKYCKLFEEVDGIMLKLKDISGDGITRARAYLTKVVGIRFPRVDAKWAELKIYNRLRTVIVHRNAEINWDDPKDHILIQYSKDTNLLSITKEGRFLPDVQLLWEAQNLYAGLFEELREDLASRYEQLRAAK